jgi:hypothetical protein
MPTPISVQPTDPVTFGWPRSHSEQVWFGRQRAAAATEASGLTLQQRPHV